MKPDWDKLGMEYKDSSSVLIGDADCTVEQELCSKYGVRGYPTVKYFTAETGDQGKDYQGGRDFTSLKKFVDTELASPCEIDDTSNCDERQVNYIEKMSAKSAEDVKKQLTRLEGMKGKSMKPELKQWLLKRIAILKQFDAKSDL